MCGERVHRTRYCTLGYGSSPRVRGTHYPVHCFRYPSRFIPACAGNASTITITPEGITVHPRVCGERVVAAQLALAKDGSSPRVRGTPNLHTALVCGFRFIPACAGNAYPQVNTITPMSVHPRVCGERPNGENYSLLTYGSSPRVRGTLERRQCSKNRSRFIPACAGNAGLPQSWWGHTAVHPRVCGERSNCASLRYLYSGSSPRVRGTPLYSLH